VALLTYALGNVALLTYARSIVIRAGRYLKPCSRSSSGRGDISSLVPFVSCRRCSPNAPFAKLEMLTADQPRRIEKLRARL
jgi:hypothetical protein